MFRHIITSKNPVEWEEIRKEAEERMGQKLSGFIPFFIHWNDINLDVTNPVEQVANAALWEKIRTILHFGRRNQQILVIQASAANLDEIMDYKAENKIAVKMKHEILANSFIYVTNMGATS